MRRLIASLVLVSLCAVAHPSEISGPLATLDGAIEARIAAIGTPAPDPAQAKESKKLAKARKEIAKFKGTLDVPGLTALGRAAKALDQSATADAGVTSAAQDAILALVACFDEQEQALVERVNLNVYTLADQDRATALIAAARADVAAVTDLAETDPDGAFRLLVTAAVKYGKAAKFIEKTIVRLESAPQPRFSYPLTALNLNGKKYTISSVTFDVNYTPPGGGDPVRVKFDMKDFDDATGFVLPYKLLDRESECELYPAFHAGLTAAVGGSPDGGTFKGSMRFVSSKHGTVDVPLEDFVSAP